MQEKGQVIAISNDAITVIPLITDACLSCTAGCAKRGKPFTVSNPSKLPVSQGSIVRVGASKGAAGIGGLVALLFPFACAVGGYFAATPIAALFHKTAGDGLRALFVLLFLVASAAIVFFISRKAPLPGKPEIIEVY